MEEVTHLPILIIDDNPFSRDILSNYLGINGYRVEEAKNGKEALDYVGRNLYQLIIIYLIMPGMSGFKTVEKIRKMSITIPILAHSSISSREDQQRCL